MEIPFLIELEKKSGKRINTILQLRLHQNVIALKKEIQTKTSGEKHEVSIEFITARGNWYFNSWKGRAAESGGIVTNIGIHLFDLLIWLFGNVEDVGIEHYGRGKVSGHLELRNARVKWMLSIDENDLPGDNKESGKRFFRQLNINGISLRLDDGMEGLHTACYKEILAGNGPGIVDASPSIELCNRIQRMAD